MMDNKERDRLYHQRKYQARKSSGLCLKCDKPAITGKTLCQDHLDERRIYQNKHHQQNKGRINRNRSERRKVVRIEVLNIMGAYCRCCGEATIEFLCIDHVDGNGASHRKEVIKDRSIYQWLKKNNYPEGFQVLCWNCNAAKYLYGICPHKEDKGRR